MIRRLLLVVVSSVMLMAAGCGGDSDRSRLEHWEAEGLWSGTTSSGTLDGVVLDTGEYWFIYGSNGVARSVIHGNGYFSNGDHWRSDDGADYFFGFDRPFVSSLGSTVRPEFAIDGEIFIGGLLEAFSVGFAPEYNSPANPAAIVGQRSGSGSTLLTSGDFVINIDAFGNFSAGLAGDCNYTGRAVPNRNGRNVFDIVLTPVPGCRSVASSTGVMVATGGRLVITAITTDRRDVFYAVAR